MAEPENKDKIKEILEGHNKKFTTTELIVGILVVLIIGSGIGYAIFKLLTPTTPSNQVVTEIKQTIPQPMQNEENNTTVTQPQPTQAKQENTEKIAKTETISPAPVENSTQSTQETIQQTQEKLANTSTGPQIIPPIPQNTKSNAQENITSKISKTSQTVTKTVKTKNQTKKTSTQIAYVSNKLKHTYKHRKVYLKHKYVIQVSSNKNRKLALLAVIKLRKNGHKAYTKRVIVKGERYTRVYVGPVRGYYSAKEEAEKIKNQLHLKYFPLIIKDD